MGSEMCIRDRPRGRSFPLALGIKTRRNGMGRYPRRFNRPMASHRTSGDFHFSRSTPAVRAPWFIATRLTADALAENERVRDRCKAFTLRQSLSCVAFAIRICIARTFRSTRRQLMSPHRCGMPEGADSSSRINAVSYTHLTLPTTF